MTGTVLYEVRRARDQHELAAALELRHAVFCVEQGVPEHDELDGRDHEGIHLVAVENGELLGTCRIVIVGQHRASSAGSPSARTRAGAGSPRRCSTSPTPRRASLTAAGSCCTPRHRREFDAGHVPITEEFDSPRRTLPPVLTLVIALVVVVVFIVGIAYVFRAKPVAQGQIDNVFISQNKGQPNSMLAIQVTLGAVGDKPLYIKEITAELKTPTDTYTDEAASPSDYDRYFQAYPDLKEHAMKPLAVETKIPPGRATNRNGDRDLPHRPKRV